MRGGARREERSREKEASRRERGDGREVTAQSVLKLLGSVLKLLGLRNVSGRCDGRGPVGPTGPGEWRWSAAGKW